MTTDAFPAEAADPMCLPHATLVELLAGVPYRRFGVVGDSLSAGTGDATPGYRPLGWSDRVAQLLREAHPRSEYRNVAVIGATTRETLDDQLDEMLRWDPDLLHLPCGANDLMPRRIEFDTIERDLRTMYERALRSRAQLITFTFGRAFVVPRIPDWHERITRMNELTRKVAAEHGAIVVDFWDHPVNDRPDLVSADGIHFAGVGQAVMATEEIRAINSFDIENH